MPKIGLAWWLLVLGLLLGGRAWGQTCTQTTLHDEFFNDPTTRGYVSCATDGDLAGANVDDTCVLQRFNALCTGNPACKTDNILTREEIIETIVDSAELEKLARSTAANDAARRAQLGWLLEMSPFNLARASWQQKWKNVFTPADSPLTNTAINNAQMKDAPRSQVVCGRTGTINDVSCGLRGAACP